MEISGTASAGKGGKPSSSKRSILSVLQDSKKVLSSFFGRLREDSKMSLIPQRMGPGGSGIVTERRAPLRTRKVSPTILLSNQVSATHGLGAKTHCKLCRNSVGLVSCEGISRNGFLCGNFTDCAEAWPKQTLEGSRTYCAHVGKLSLH